MSNVTVYSFKGYDTTTVSYTHLDVYKRQNPIFLLYTNHTDSNHYPYGPAGTVRCV